MKNLLFINLFLGILFACCISCGSNNKETSEVPFNETMSADDTTAVLTQTRACMDLLKAGEVEKAFDNVYYIEEPENMLTSIPDSIKERMVARFKRFPVVDYKLERLYFAKYDSNEVNYSFQFVPERPDMTMSVVFNPVKLEDSWYITIKNGRR